MGDRGSKEAKKPQAIVKQAATPLQLTGKISKNQRATYEKQKPKKWHCPKGHEMQVIKVAYVRGPTKTELVCACSKGFGEDDGRIVVVGGDAWKQRKARINVSTRARIWYEYPSKETT